VLPNINPHWQAFRTEHLWTIEVNDVLEANLQNLKALYGRYLNISKKTLTLHDCQTMVMNALKMNEKDVQLAYGMSKMSLFNEGQQYKQY
jgi:hypothetical protein